MHEQPRKEHEWLHRLAGSWTYEMEADMGPGHPPEAMSGTVDVRVLEGGLWIIGEMHGRNHDGTPTTSILTLGYDTARERFVGSFVAPSLTHLWLYDGQLAADGRTLALDTEGPSMSDPTKRGRYRDRVELQGRDEYVFTSSALGEDGQWRDFMTMRHRLAR